MTWQIASVFTRAQLGLTGQGTKLVPGILSWEIGFGVLYASLSAVLVSGTTNWQANTYNKLKYIFLFLIAGFYQIKICETELNKVKP